MVTITLTVDEANNLLNLLAKLPFIEVNNLIVNIFDQAKDQVPTDMQEKE